MIHFQLSQIPENYIKTNTIRAQTHFGLQSFYCHGSFCVEHDAVLLQGGCGNFSFVNENKPQLNLKYSMAQRFQSKLLLSAISATTSLRQTRKRLGFGLKSNKVEIS
jgi:hypothetical protein